MSPSASVVLVCGYALLLLVVAWLLDRAGAKSSARSAAWRTGNFVYHDDQDAWRCHQDQWLYPASFDPEKRVIRYQGQHAICGRCPAKPDCSPTPGPREVTRAIDPWPHSEAGRFHRGLSLVVGVIAVLMPAFMLLGSRSTADVVCLLATVGTGLIASWPLARHLWNTPSNFPEHLPLESSAPASGPVAAAGAASRGRSLPIVETTSRGRATAPTTDARRASSPAGTLQAPVSSDTSDVADAAARAQELIDRYSTRWRGDARRRPAATDD